MGAVVMEFRGFGGIRLMADAWGEPEHPTVLLLHGGGQSRRSLKAAAQALVEAGRYAICLDLRGHGDSGWSADGRYDLDAFAGDLLAVLAQLPSRPVIVGASLGGMVALAALGEGEAELASGLVLVDVAANPDPVAVDRIAGLMRSHADGFQDLEEAAAAASALSPHRPTRADGEGLRDHLVAGADGRLRWRWDPRFLDGFRAVEQGARLERAAARLRLPTLIVRGAESLVMPADQAVSLAGLIKDADRAEIEGAGHLVAADRAEGFNALLLEFLERRLPRAPLNYTAGADPRTLRDALGCFSTGVTVVTARDGAGRPVGLTANSFTSVSLDPPLILFCLAKSSGNLAVFQECGHFAVNVLHIGQQPTSNRFARRGDEDRFADVAWEAGETGSPLLTGALAAFDCAREAVHDGGDHLIFVGRVLRVKFEPRRDPLLYFRGRYRRLHFA